MTARSGTLPSSTRRSREKAKLTVPTVTASTPRRARSRNQSLMYRAEKVPVAIWTTSTLTVTTKPVRPTADATIVVSTVCAVPAE